MTGLHCRNLQPAHQRQCIMCVLRQVIPILEFCSDIPLLAERVNDDCPSLRKLLKSQTEASPNRVRIWNWHLLRDDFEHQARHFRKLNLNPRLQQAHNILSPLRHLTDYGSVLHLYGSTPSVILWFMHSSEVFYVDVASGQEVQFKLTIIRSKEMFLLVVYSNPTASKLVGNKCNRRFRVGRVKAAENKHEIKVMRSSQRGSLPDAT
mmetsp:Transcript_54413/g.86478  ORF Transcript_54413/g.86478 Transcript_54413/m.86478 type:complete len:207 (-) Transcript_54413:237-857(-)